MAIANITPQPAPRIPTISFFQPITTDPSDMMTDIEYLLGILKKLNEMISTVNAHTEFINEYSGKIEEIETQITSLRQEMIDFEDKINEEIAAEFADIRSQLTAIVNAAVIQANAYTDTRVTYLEELIQEVSTGNIQVYDPTNGVLSPLQTVIDNLFGATREDALTATEYDSLELTATTYDGYEITAFDYDQKGKIILMGS